MADSHIIKDQQGVYFPPAGDGAGKEVAFTIADSMCLGTA